MINSHLSLDGELHKLHQSKKTYKNEIMPKVLFLTIVIHGMAKEGEWIDQNVDLDQLAKKIDQFFKSEGLSLIHI